MKSALDCLIEELEAGIWVQPEEPEKDFERMPSSPCGSPLCAGCYGVGDGKRIHPPKCGEDYLRG
jgi:hypothetical protein